MDYHAIFDTCETAEQLRRKYLELALLMHSDKSFGPDAVQQFQNMQAAYEEAREQGGSVGDDTRE